MPSPSCCPPRTCGSRWIPLGWSRSSSTSSATRPSTPSRVGGSRSRRSVEATRWCCGSGTTASASPPRCCRGCSTSSRRPSRRSIVPDVMLIDIGLPGIDGYEVARRIRREPGLERVVLVALTGYGREGDKKQALAAGFDYHLAKPVNPDTLQDLVARLGSAEAGRPQSGLH